MQCVDGNELDKLAHHIADIIEKRKALGWAVPDEIVHKNEELTLV